ncbi:MAG: peptidylprolyl isomerase [Pirellulales bacterium]|nr:peptidylprolyl isomerase [Pirellulales bacterium]
MTFLKLLTAWAVIAVSVPLAAQQSETGVGPVPGPIRSRFVLDDFYQKYLDVGGLPVVGSHRVSDAAIAEAAWIVQQMIGHRPDILAAMAKNKTRLAVMAHNEYTTDVPEHRHLKSRVFWDRRARGLGATPSAPAVSCAEENVLCFPGDPYFQENICIHEFAHAIHAMGMSVVDPSFDERLKVAYEAALAAGKWKDSYAAVNRDEYWAEAVQSWFDDNRQNDALHNHVDTRAELKQYDPRLAELCRQVFGDRPWRYQKPLQRDAAQRAHLAGFDFETLPRFRWRDEPIPNRAKVLIQTTWGDIEVELDSSKAPKTVANFLHYVHQGLYSDGIFHRSVTLQNQPEDQVKIEVIQASANPKRESEFLPAIPLERTSQTGIKHLRGTISMAREADPDTARDHFFICLSDQPELDFGGKRERSGQGFAAFGVVTKGMEVVEKIHQSPTEQQALQPPIRIQRAIRLN